MKNKGRRNSAPGCGKRKFKEVHARKIRIVIIIEAIEGTGAVRARLHDLDSNRMFECEEQFANDVECMDAGERLVIAATQKARWLLRLPGYPDAKGRAA